jgi:hypothetical protein
LFNNELNDERSVATGDDSSNIVGDKIFIFYLKTLRKYGLIFADEGAIFVSLQKLGKGNQYRFQAS